jgi:hypothetical protein
MNDHPVSKVGKLFTRRLKCLPTAEITRGNISKAMKRKLPLTSNQKPGNTFFGLEINVTAQSNQKPGNTFSALKKIVTATKESPLRAELNAALLPSKV